MPVPRRLLPAASLALTVAAALVLAPTAGASSGSITGLQRLSDGNLQATFTASFDQCSGSYCGWYPKATQVLGAETCSAGASTVWIGSLQSSSGTQSATRSFLPTSRNGQVRVCLYGMQSGSGTLLAQEVYTPDIAPDQATGSITNVRRTATGEIEATWAITYSKCTSSGYCGWYSTAHQLPAAQQCSASGTTAWVGDSQTGPARATGTQTFSQRVDGAMRLCLYVHQGDVEELVGQTVWTPPQGTATGDISGVRTAAGKVTARFSMTADVCSGHASCSWRPLAFELPAATSCPATHDGHQVYGGEYVSGAATQARTVTFTSRYPGQRIRLCLYAHWFYTADGLQRSERLVAQAALRASRPPAPPPPKDKPFTMGRAKKAVNEALWRRFGASWFGRSNYRRSCQRLSAHKVRCQVSWTYVRDTYSGRVTVWVVGRQWTQIHYSVRILHRRPV